MIEVPLTSGRNRVPSGLVALIDDEDAERVFGAGHWRLMKANNRLYAATGQSTLMHRLLMNAPRDLEVDHINGDGLDNCRSNLRLATHSQNLSNQVSRRVWSRRPTTSKYKGVTFFSYQPRKKPWRATISVNRKQMSLGYFATEIEAAQAYDNAAKHYYPGHALLNFPDK